MTHLMTDQRLERENSEFRGSGGVSQGNRKQGFRPAFCDLETGRVELSCFAPGVPAPIHLLTGLPDEWIVTRNPATGSVVAKESVIAGFVRDDRFYTREEAARAVQH